MRHRVVLAVLVVFVSVFAIVPRSEQAAQAQVVPQPSVPAPFGAVNTGAAERGRPFLSPDGSEVFTISVDFPGERSGYLEARNVVAGDVRTVYTSTSTSAVGAVVKMWDITSDGTKLLVSALTGFDVGNGRGHEQLFLVDTVSGELTQVTPTLDDGEFYTYGIDLASMSADGSRIGFRSINSYFGNGFVEQVYYASAGTLTNQLGIDGAPLDWIHVLGDGQLLLPGNPESSLLSILDPSDGSFVDVPLPSGFPIDDPLFRLRDPMSSDDGSVIVWDYAGHVMVWDRDTDLDGVLDEQTSSAIYEPGRGVAGYYGNMTGQTVVATDGSTVMFTSQSPSSFTCLSEQPASSADSSGPSEFNGGIAAVAWSRSTHSVTYVAEIEADPIGLNCGQMPSVTLSSNGSLFGIHTNEDFSDTGLEPEGRVWVSPVTQMQRRNIHLTFTNLFECQNESGGTDLALCPGNGVDASSDGDFYSRVWFADGRVLDTDLPLVNEFGDIGGFDDDLFRTITGSVLEVLPAVDVFVELWDEDSNSPDDPADISSANNRFGSVITFEPLTGRWSADGEPDQAWFRGDGDTEHVSNGGHPTLLGFDISAIRPRFYKTAQPGDADGDGLLDGWEINGLTVVDVDSAHPVTGANPATVTVLDPVWGATPLGLDLFVENDWISDGSVSAVPVYRERDNNNYSDIVESFALAPTPINLRFDTGNLTSSGTYTTPKGTLSPTVGDHGVDLGGGNEVVIGTGSLAHIDEVCSVRSDDFYDVKALHFDPNRRWIFRYALTGRASIYPGAPLETRADGSTYRSCGRGGNAEIGGNDILNLRSDAVVMMHELGHSLTLRHGGDSNIHCKPNYVSIMNYAYDKTRGLPLFQTGRLMDYSPARYSSGVRSALMADLDESNLNEENPFDPANDEHVVRYGDAQGNSRTRRADRNPNYSGDQSDPPFETGVVASINHQDGLVRDCVDSATDEILTDHDDWKAVTLPFRGSGDYDDASTLVVSDEEGYIEHEEEAAVYDAAIGRADLRLDSVLTGDSNGFQITASIASLDKPTIIGPVITVEPSNGVTLSNLPSGCEAINTGYVCLLESFDSGTVPHSSELITIELTVDPSAIDPQILVTATSEDNPVSNDPDPTNNNTTHTLDGTIPNLPPVATDDAETVMAGESVEIDVLANDSDPDNNLDESTLTIVNPPAIGTALVSDTGEGPEITYVAPTGTSDVTSFLYQVCDDTGLCDSATVTITIMAESDCTITGTQGDDTLSGTPGPDVICGLGGNDTITGGDGDDVIFGGSGDDVIDAGNGNDMALGGRGADTITGGDGDDVLKGRRGGDNIYGNAGDDVIRGGRGEDTLFGDEGNDIIYGGKRADTLRGGIGDDTLRGRRGNDTLRGGAGADKLYGGRGQDKLYGGAGADKLWGRRGADELYGNNGQDILNGGWGQDIGNGGNGSDECRNIETTSSCEVIS